MRSERLLEGLTECEGHVLDSVMGVNFQIATRMYSQVEQAMAAKLRQHVIEKRQARLRCHRAAPVEAQCDPDIGFGSCAVDRCGGPYSLIVHVALTCSIHLPRT